MVKYLSYIILPLFLIVSASVDNISEYINIKKQISSYKYQYETGDYWKTPEETMKDNGGDCEDFAILADYLFREYVPNSNPRMYIIYIDEDSADSTAAHALAVVNNPYGTVSVISDNMIEESTEKQDVPAILKNTWYWNVTSIWQMVPVEYGEMNHDKYMKNINQRVWVKPKGGK